MTYDNSEKKTILYIEDDLSNRVLVKRVLESEGYIVLEAEDGQSGMAIVKANRPDLILMDINMPGINGYELTSMIKSTKEFSSIPIVALTVAVGKGEKEKAFNAGCDGFISKPIDVDLFPKQILKYLKDSV